MAERKTARKATARKAIGKSTSKWATRKAGCARDCPGKEGAAKTLVAARDRTKRRDALDLRQGVFTLTDPKKIAASLKTLGGTQFAPQGRRLPLAALSMLTFYINRAGKACRRRNARGWNGPRVNWSNGESEKSKSRVAN